MKITRFVALAALTILLFACEKEEVFMNDSIENSMVKSKSAASNNQDSGLQSITSESLDVINEGLAAEGMNYRIAMAEYIIAGDSGEAGQTVLSKIVGNKQLGHDFVPNDSRRAWSSDDGNAITYAIDQTDDAVPLGGDLTAKQTDMAIERATTTWEDASCSDLGLNRYPDFGLDIGIVAFQFGLGGSPFIFADVQHAGFTDINFAGDVLGVTYTFNFCDPCGADPVFTDIDNNGKMDTAFTEIYYDPSWIWADDGESGVDVESIAVHEIGHGLSQEHFGTVVIKNKGGLKASPRAVMNALYTGPFRKLKGTDIGGHCSIWAQWPNN